MKFAAAALVLLLGAPAFADLVTNGNFENSSPAAGTFSYSTLSSGDTTSIPGWTVGGSGGVDLMGTYWTAHGGSNSIDLSGSANGSITQTIATISGERYRLIFWMAGNPDGGPNSKTMNVATGSITTGYSFDTAANNPTSSHSNLGFLQVTFNWVATANNESLTFTSTTGTAFGVVLDDISVNAIPEPGTFALFGLGLGALGVWRRRVARKARPVAKS